MTENRNAARELVSDVYCDFKRLYIAEFLLRNAG